MFDFWIAALVGFGVGGWVFFKINRGSGDSNGGANAITGVIVGVILTIILFTLFKFILHL